MKRKTLLIPLALIMLVMVSAMALAYGGSYSGNHHTYGSDANHYGQSTHSFSIGQGYSSTRAYGFGNNHHSGSYGFGSSSGHSSMHR